MLDLGGYGSTIYAFSALFGQVSAFKSCMLTFLNSGLSVVLHFVDTEVF